MSQVGKDGLREAGVSELETFRMYIDGEWRESASGRWFESKNPYTGKVWARLPRADARDVEAAVQAAHAGCRCVEPFSDRTLSD